VGRVNHTGISVEAPAACPGALAREPSSRLQAVWWWWCGGERRSAYGVVRSPPPAGPGAGASPTVHTECRVVRMVAMGKPRRWRGSEGGGANGKARRNRWFSCTGRIRMSRVPQRLSVRDEPEHTGMVCVRVRTSECPRRSEDTGSASTRTCTEQQAG